MKILGIDPGMAIVGYGILEQNNADLRVLSSGSIRTEKTSRESTRLLKSSNRMPPLLKNFFSLETEQR